MEKPCPLNLDFTYNHVATNGWNFENCFTRRNRTGPYDPNDVVAALLHARGNLTEAARLVGRRRQAFKHFVDGNPEIYGICVEIRECVLDTVEQNALRMAEEGDPSMVRFVLQTLGKNRGWTTRVENTGKDGGAIEIDTSDAKDKLRALLGSRQHVDPGESVETGEAL